MSDREPLMTTTMALRLQQVPASHGVRWLRHGFKVFKRFPLGFVGLFGMFMFAGLVAMQLPVLGTALLLMALPILSLGFMLATHGALQGHRPTVAVFIAPFRLTPARRKTQLMLCASYALGTVLIMVISDWVDGGAFDRFETLLSGGKVDEAKVAEALADPLLAIGSLTRLSLAALLSVPYWHASALVHWGGQRSLQALFSSTLAVWRNRGAFFLNAMAWLGVMIAFGLITSLLAALLGLNNFVAVIALPAGLLFSTVFYASLYFTFIDSFLFTNKDEPAEAPPSSS
nr:BPSS1780 family membrane protein [uncultured Roseateles sp.]